MNPLDGIDDRPPVLRVFTPEEEQRILEEIKNRPFRDPKEINKPRVVQTQRGPITFY